MSRSNVHDGVSCDSCGRDNFSGRRMKCLKCFDFDLCESCYIDGFRTERHLADHPMQCILTREDYDLLFSGDGAENPYMPRSFTCPHCGEMGYTESTLCEHVLLEHGDFSSAVMCPICASTQNADANLMTEDLVTHISIEHSRLDYAQTEEGRPSRRSGNSRGGQSRASRRLGHQSTQQNNTARDGDAIAGLMSELISHLGGLRRAGTALTSTMNHIQQLQQQISRQTASKRTAAATDGGQSNGATPSAPPSSVFKFPIVHCDDPCSTWCEIFENEEENKESFTQNAPALEPNDQQLVGRKARFGNVSAVRVLCNMLELPREASSSSKTSIHAHVLRKHKSEGDLAVCAFP
uniref:RING-type E3 ubiquitin transferase n=1 Tax=Trichuris muris TaxID=70415 RepID=A0A5S6QGK8_TRIMR